MRRMCVIRAPISRSFFQDFIIDACVTDLQILEI